MVDDKFELMIQRVRRGDPDAAATLVKEFEPEIRRLVRCRLTDSRLRQMFDSIDVCQSVFGRFFVRAAAGQFDLDKPDQLLRLLATMARNRVREAARHHHARRRDCRKARLVPEEGPEFPDHAATPSRVAAGRDLLAQTLAKLTEEERFLASARAEGREWESLAEELGESAEALRKRLSRALDRVADEFELDM